MKILRRILKGPHEDLAGSLKILERFSLGNVMVLEQRNAPIVQDMVISFPGGSP